jgi:predicted transcriptional regulator/predicted amino acid-binding ACT domain protein
MELQGTTKNIMEQLLKYNTTKEIAQQLNLHPKNVDRYIRVLRDLGLLTTKKGRAGGVYLTKEGTYLVEKNKISLITTKVQIIAKDRIGLLADISLNISNLGGNILSTTLEKEGDTIVVIWLTVDNIAINEITELKNILKEDIKKLVIV